MESLKADIPVGFRWNHAGNGATGHSKHTLRGNPFTTVNVDFLEVDEEVNRDVEEENFDDAFWDPDYRYESFAVEPGVGSCSTGGFGEKRSNSGAPRQFTEPS